MVFQTNLVQTILSRIDPTSSKTITLTPGQIFNGKIIKLYPGQLATLQLGGLTLTAKLDAPLTVGNRSWLQVQPGEGIPVLKVIEGVDRAEKNLARESENVLRQLGINHSKLNDLVFRYFAKEGLPFTREHVLSGTETLQTVGITNDQGLANLKFLVERNIPITPETFSAINSVINGHGLIDPLQELLSSLQSFNPNYSDIKLKDSVTDPKEPIIVELKQFLETLLKDADLKVDEPEKPLSKQLASLIMRIGYQHERDVLQLMQQPNQKSESPLNQLKLLLFKSQQLQLPRNIQEKIETIMERITGQQLLSTSQEGPIANYVVMIPVKLFGKETDLTLQWEGKKDKNGKLSPDHCRILFYLNLQNLNDTIIDVQIQSRIVSLHIINEQKKPANLITTLQPYLKQALLEQNYQLTSVKWIETKQEPKNNSKNHIFASPTNYQSPKPYQGVDIRI